LKQEVKYKSKSSLYAVLIFLFSPILAVVGVILNKDLDAAKFVIPFFTALLGYTIVPSEESDVFKLIDKFNLLSTYSFDEFITYLFLSDGNLQDEGIEVFITSLSFLVGIFTDNTKILLAVYGFILGVITLKVVVVVLHLPQRSKNTLFVTALFSFIIFWNMPVNSINGRFYLAFWFYLFAVIYYLTTEKKKYLLISILAVLIHQGYLLGAGILVLWALTKRIKFRNYLYIATFVITLLLPSGSGLRYLQQVDINLVENSNLTQKLEGYTSETYIEIQKNIGSNRSAIWNFYRLSSPVLKFAVTLTLAYIFLFMKKVNNRLNLDFIYFIILFYSFVNYFADVPSLGIRYTGILLAISVIFIYKTESEDQVKIYQFNKMLLFFALLFRFLVKLRIDLEHLNAFVFFASAPSLFIGVPDQSFIELLKSLF
jgi:hypothetical protein